MYEPREDSELMAEFLAKIIEKEKPKTFLDMGCGSGLQSVAALRVGMRKKGILAVDIDDLALKETKKLGIHAVKSDLFKNVEGKFDLIAFNPPYLPAERYDKQKDTTGGKEGWETIERFLSRVKNHLAEKGKILLLFSSLTNRKKVGDIIKSKGFKFRLLTEKNLFMEHLYLVLLERV